MPGPTTVAFLKGDHVLLVKKSEGLRKQKHVWDLPKEASISAELGTPVHVIDWIGGAIKVYGSANSMPPITHSSLLTVDAIRRIPTKIRDSTDRTVRHARVQPLLEYLSHPTGLPFLGTDLKLAEPTVNRVDEDDRAAAWMAQPFFVLNDEAYNRLMHKLRAGSRYEFTYMGACPHKRKRDCQCPEMMNMLDESGSLVRIVRGVRKPVYRMCQVTPPPATH
jgi:hypothetical protein